MIRFNFMKSTKLCIVWTRTLVDKKIKEESFQKLPKYARAMEELIPDPLLKTWNHSKNNEASLAKFVCDSKAYILRIKIPKPKLSRLYTFETLTILRI